MGEDLHMRNAAQRPSIDAEGLLREYAMTGNTAIRDRVVEAYLYTASIIARRFSGRGVDYDDLYQVADEALYVAKRAGKSQAALRYLD